MQLESGRGGREEASSLVFLIRDPKETERWGEALGMRLQSGDVVALIGDLGAGKTTLTQAIARGMGIVAPVTSPTFTLVQQYPGPTPLFHIDPYRLDMPVDLSDLGVDAYMLRAGVVVVEWADRVLEQLPEERLILMLEILAEGSAEVNAEVLPRRLTVRAEGKRPEALMQALRALPEVVASAGEGEGAG